MKKWHEEIINSRIRLGWELAQVEYDNLMKEKVDAQLKLARASEKLSQCTKGSAQYYKLQSVIQQSHSRLRYINGSLVKFNGQRPEIPA